MRTLALGLLALVGCTSEPPVRPEPPFARVDLRAAINAGADVNPIGVAVHEGHRFVLDENLGLWRLDGETAENILFQMPDPGPTAPLRFPLTDIVAVAQNQFALTAIGDGYILDTQALTLTQRFCYVPDGGDGFPVSIQQRTDALTYDEAEQLLYAQPITLDPAGTFLMSEIAVYEYATGSDIAWYRVQDDVAATAMIKLPVGLVLGQNANLSVFDLARSEVVFLEDLRRFGVVSIDGLALDDDRLVVVDRQADAIIDIELSQLAL